MYYNQNYQTQQLVKSMLTMMMMAMGVGMVRPMMLQKGKTGNLDRGEYVAAILVLKKVDFLYEAFLYSVEEIRDAVMDRNADKIYREISRGKMAIQSVAKKARPDIRAKYLPEVLESFDTFEFNIRVDLDKYAPELAWIEIEEHLWEFRDRNMHHLILATKDVT